MPSADRNHLGSSLQKTALIKDIHNVSLALGQKKRDQRTDHFPHPQDNKQNSAEDDDNAQTADKWIRVNRKNSAYPNDQNAKQRGKYPPFDFYARIKPFKIILRHGNRQPIRESSCETRSMTSLAVLVFLR